MALRLREPKVYLVGKSAEELRRDTRMRVLLLHHERNVVRDGVPERQSGGVAAGSHHACWGLTPHFPGYPAPCGHRAANRLPVLPGPGTIERVEIEQLKSKPDLRKHVPFDAALRTDEERLDAPICFYKSPRDCQPRIKVAASATAGE